MSMNCSVIITGKSERSRKQPNFYGNAWPSDFMGRSLLNSKVKRSVKRKETMTPDKPKQFNKKFQGIKSLRDYVPETTNSDEDDDYNSGKKCEYQFYSWISV